MKIIPQGVGFSKLPKSPHAIFAILTSGDFINPTATKANANTIANPDDYQYLKGSTPGGATGAIAGYDGALAKIDLSQAMRIVGMTGLQSVYIDNSQGGGVCVLRNSALGLTVTAPPFSQGHYPLLLPEGSLFTFDVAYIDATSDNTVLIPSFSLYPDTNGQQQGGGGIYNGVYVESGFLRLQFSDMIVPPSVWSTRNWANGYWFDLSSTIAAGGAFQNALSFDTFRKGFMIGNPIAQTEPLYVSLFQAGMAESINNTIPLAPGQIYQDKSLPLYTGVVRVMATTIAHPYMAKFFQ